MKKTKYIFTNKECQFIIHALNSFRNSLIAEGKFTDTVDDAMLAFKRAKTKRIKVAG